MTPGSVARGLGVRARTLAYLLRSGAPVTVLWAWVRTQGRWQLKPGRFIRLRDQVRAKERGEFSTDWFSQHAPHWLACFESLALPGRATKALEIGCWEGRSTCFILDQLPKVRLTAVDTWRGSDEHGSRQVEPVERRFDANVGRFGRRVAKRKGSSLAFFAARGKDDFGFDLAYVDGSHRADDVLCDCVLAFERLKVGGLLVLDDYAWRFYPRLRDNPAPAVNAFLRLKRGHYRLLLVDYQVYLTKTAEG